MIHQYQIKRWQWILLLIITAVFVFLQFYNRYHWTEAKVVLKEKELNVLVAKTLYQQHKGLGGREEPKGFSGMIFPYSYSAKHAMMMREMEFPIDIIWLNNGKVVDLAPNVPIEPGVPEEQLKKYYPRADANLVLELPAGWSEENELKIGDKLQILDF